MSIFISSSESEFGGESSEVKAEVSLDFVDSEEKITYNPGWLN